MKIRCLAAALSAAILMTACGTSAELTKNVKPLDIAPVDCTPEFRDAQMQFTVSLLQKSAEQKDGNLLLSPYLAASQWLTAADESITAPDIFGGMARAELNGSMVKWRGTLAVLQKAQSLWIAPEQRSSLKPDYLRFCLGLSGTQVFAAERTPAALNQWVSEATGGAVSEITAPQNADAAMLGALSYALTWSSPYGDNEIRNVLFYNADGSQKSAPFLCKDADSVMYLEDEAVTGMRKDCDGNQLAFVAVMPKSGTVDSLLQNLTAEQLSDYISFGVQQTMRTQFPQFNADDTQDIAALLPETGCGTIIQHVSTEIGKGTQKATFSMQLGDDESSKTELVFDHPFAFFVVDRYYGLPLIAGTVEQLS